MCAVGYAPMLVSAQCINSVASALSVPVRPPWLPVVPQQFVTVHWLAAAGCA
jgi:hypothetical protein